MALALHTCYHHKINDNVQISAELEGSVRTQECTTTVGYQIDLPSANVQFRGEWYTYLESFLSFFSVILTRW